MAEVQDWGQDLELILDAARQAGEIAHGFFGRSPEVWWKNEGRSPVSAADFAANDRLLNLLLAARPNYGWLSEETDDDVARLSCETLFVVDPIDGTRAFINGEKTWCVSVAVVHRGQPVAGVLVAPALDEEFCAAKDGPALKNGRPISVTGERANGELVIAADENLVKKFEPGFRDEVRRVRHVPSLAYRLAMIADGSIDGTVVKRASHDWDLAAADLILERAGGRLIDLAGNRLVYNRESVVHEMLAAGAEHALRSLLPQLAGLAPG
ncbi:MULTISPECIES: 3'(2'),5'-bisphosphate nucleotidase CysQ [unclassified Neorhizobium]|uniref:3'(2'),5'-bisphosphate nucleotidase CysQ n=1 Tax=unclassified Neorhizobium TaxID=2629175 RepID=UPI001FF127DE|nr:MULTISPECIES: 3'(2'),5'-bisphosphate nucleotidase CysQ [unclassified Neorhizobium]MCJ9673430.1 3'(2'),5'-bisphosphate nucleotidase CysQ [Neorhizobium sp. SHOUNA12B]MCJ9748744.1 3'(2'),5'-bisphosphate nucleotidase CysQ [Neorhizobium sp. SHOUNA12A]